MVEPDLMDRDGDHSERARQEQRRFGGDLDAFRIEHGAPSVASLANSRVVGMSKGNLSAIFNGERLPTIDVTLELVRAITKALPNEERRRLEELWRRRWQQTKQLQQQAEKRARRERAAAGRTAEQIVAEATEQAAQIRAQAQADLEQASRQAMELLTGAKAKAAEAAQAQAEVERIRAEAAAALAKNDTPARVLALAQQTADQAIEEARNEANRLVKDAQVEAQRLLVDAREEAARILAGTSPWEPLWAFAQNSGLVGRVGPAQVVAVIESVGVIVRLEEGVEGVVPFSEWPVYNDDRAPYVPPAGTALYLAATQLVPSAWPIKLSLRQAIDGLRAKATEATAGYQTFVRDFLDEAARLGLRWPARLSPEATLAGAPAPPPTPVRQARELAPGRGPSATDRSIRSNRRRAERPASPPFGGHDT